MTDPRSLKTPLFYRRTAGSELLAETATWEVWTCDGPTFQHDYDQGVTLCVERGAAVVNFADGSHVDLQPGDALTIAQGASAVWLIGAPIQNRYAYQRAT